MKAPRIANTILVNGNGKPYANANASALSTAIMRPLRKRGLNVKGEPGRSLAMHSLRKNAASEVAALLVGAASIKSVTDHGSDAMAEYYAKHVEKLHVNEIAVRRWDEALVKQNRGKARRASIQRVKKAILEKNKWEILEMKGNLCNWQ